MSDLIAQIALGKTAAVVLHSHDLSIGTGRTDGQQIASTTAVQVNLLGKDISRLADGSHDVIGILGLLACHVLNLVIGLIECRTDEVGKSSIDNAEFLNTSLLNI